MRYLGYGGQDVGRDLAARIERGRGALRRRGERRAGSGGRSTSRPARDAPPASPAASPVAGHGARPRGGPPQRGCSRAPARSRCSPAPSAPTLDRRLRAPGGRPTRLGQLVYDAACSDLVEWAADSAQAEVAAWARERGLFCGRRFSPGYGDLPLEVQPRLLDVLDAPRRLGLTATRDLLLVPTKSVTAVVGIYPQPPRPDAAPLGCGCCALRDDMRLPRAGAALLSVTGTSPRRARRTNRERKAHSNAPIDHIRKPRRGPAAAGPRRQGLPALRRRHGNDAPGGGAQAGRAPRAAVPHRPRRRRGRPPRLRRGGVRRGDRQHLRRQRPQAARARHRSPRYSAAAVGCARRSGARYVAADIGPSGMLLEPLGTLSFDEAYRLFAEQARAAQDAGADLVVVETMARPARGEGGRARLPGMQQPARLRHDDLRRGRPHVFGHRPRGGRHDARRAGRRRAGRQLLARAPTALAPLVAAHGAASRASRSWSRRTRGCRRVEGEATVYDVGPRRVRPCGAGAPRRGGDRPGEDAAERPRGTCGGFCAPRSTPDRPPAARGRAARPFAVCSARRSLVLDPRGHDVARHRRAHQPDGQAAPEGSPAHRRLRPPGGRGTRSGGAGRRRARRERGPPRARRAARPRRGRLRHPGRVRPAAPARLDRPGRHRARGATLRGQAPRELRQRDA